MSQRKMESQRKAGVSHMVGQSRYRANERQAGRRPGRGSGVDGTDLFQWQRPGEVLNVKDDRAGKMLCKKCQAEVTLVEASPGKWTNRDPDTGFPHGLTCGGVGHR